MTQPFSFPGDGATTPSKAQLRQEALADFAALAAEERRRSSEGLAERFLALPEVKACDGPVMLFLSMDDELDTDPLIQGVLDAGLEVYAPHTKRKSRQMVPLRLASLNDVGRGAYGIREPRGPQHCAPEELSLVVVPAVAYDRQGYRLGRGGGYYDRFLLKLSGRALTVGVVLNRYLWDDVPREAHDQPVQLVVTEEETYRLPWCGGGPEEGP
jgi:5-formyltetrahydrofolate cyclo-ligase